jgi:hypothetical protein
VVDGALGDHRVATPRQFAPNRTFAQVAAYHHGVAESGASGDSDYTGDYRLDEPVDTDRLPIAAHEDLAEPEPGATADEFGYLLDDPAEDQGPFEGTDPETGELYDDQYTDQYADQYGEPDDDRFDAFNANTWHFKAPPPPWYRTRQALIALAAVAAAVVALVVSVVLLALGGPSDTDEAPATDTSPTPTTAASTPDTTSALPPPSPPPPPPPATSASSAASVAPPPVYERPRYEPRPTKPPEIGVTRTPITRTQISVAPQPRPGSQHR